jgi:hypothetical protein
MAKKSQTQFEPNQFTYFVLTRPTLASFGFTGYDVSGNPTFIVSSRDRTGRDIPRKFNFTRKNRTMRIPNGQKDIYGNSVVEFLRNAPYCEGSPYGAYITDDSGERVQANIYFKEVNADKDAETAIQSRYLKNEAETTALNLEGEDLLSMAALFGRTSDKQNILKFQLLEIASNDPATFMEIYKSPDRQIRSVIRRAVNKNVFKLVGKMIMWDTTQVGIDEDDAVATLMKDEKMLKSILHNIEKAK